MSLPSHYHEPESRLQQRDKLQHLIRFSDFVILIIGADGVGKSALLQQLEPDPHQEQGRTVRLQLEEMTDVTALLTGVTQALDLEAVSSNRERLQQLYKLARQLREDGLPLVLLIDDADYLTNNALELLVNFATLEKGAPPRILLTGTADFEERFRGLGLAEQLESHLHVERLEPFTADEAAEYVESLMPEGVELSQRQLFALVGQAKGYPGALRAQVVELLSSGRFRPAREYRLPLPPRHIMAAVAILLLVFGAAIWQYLPESETAPAVTERVSLPLEIAQKSPGPIEMDEPASDELSSAVADQAGKAVEPEVSRSTVDKAAEQATQAAASVVAGVVAVVPERAAGSRPLSVPRTEPKPTPGAEPKPVPRAEPKPETKPAPKPETKPAPKAEPKPVSRPEPKPVPKAEPKPAPRAEPGSAPAAEKAVAAAGSAQQWLREDELLSWPDQGYTLQVIGARSETSVRNFIKAQSQPQRFYYFRTVYKGAPWHVVVYGQYTDRASALNAVEALPESLRKLRPWARSIAGVKADIRKK